MRGWSVLTVSILAGAHSNPAHSAREPATWSHIKALYRGPEPATNLTSAELLVLESMIQRRDPESGPIHQAARLNVATGDVVYATLSPRPNGAFAVHLLAPSLQLGVAVIGDPNGMVLLDCPTRRVLATIPTGVLGASQGGDTLRDFFRDWVGEMCSALGGAAAGTCILEGWFAGPLAVLGCTAFGAAVAATCVNLPHIIDASTDSPWTDRAWPQPWAPAGPRP
jgi:hypothetical protein